jgi:hypothetical protein
MASSQSTVTLQNIVDIATCFGDIEPIINAANSPQGQPALTIANDVMNAICALTFPLKCLEINLPFFYTSMLQQDYALITTAGASVTNIAWLERGVAFDINSSSEPKTFRPVEVGRQLPQQSGSWYTNGFLNSNPLFLANFFPNNVLYYGTWGSANDGNSTLGNNPGVGSVYTNPLGVGLSMPANPITQIQDSNGNLLVLTTYGVEGTAGPVASASSAPGTTVSGAGTALTLSQVTVSGSSVTYTGTITGGASNALKGITFAITGFTNSGNNVTIIVTSSTATTLVCVTTSQVNESHAGSAAPAATTVWTVVDPYGQGIRITPVPALSGTVWQIGIVAQQKPVRFTSMQQSLFPLTDDLEPHFRQGFIAQCYRYSTHKDVRGKFKDEWQEWQLSLLSLRQKEDREQEENMFVPDRGIMGGTGGRSRFKGPYWPFNYPSS